MPTEVIVVFFWLLCCPIAGIIARSRGKKMLLGCLAGFIFGPLGIVWALFLQGGE